jgi:fructose-1,6-bisphosphatase II / sedoheptulose-1,7-bisphosphatase
MKLTKADANRTPAHIDRSLRCELGGVPDIGASAPASCRGTGPERGAYYAAGEAMRSELDKVPIRGRIVIGEGERDEVDFL